MIAKEWRDARWKLLVVTIVVLLLSTFMTPYSEIRRMMGLAEGSRVVDQGALDEMWGFYNVGGLLALGSLAVVLGITLVSAEVGSGTVLMLLSRPLSRTRVLLTKYAVCAVVLLGAAILGGTLIATLAALRGYPMDDVSYLGMLLLGLMMWLASLFALGVALLASVLFRGVIQSLTVTTIVLLFLFTFPDNVVGLISLVDYRFTPYNQAWYEALNTFAPGRYLLAWGVFEGETLGAAKLLYWTVAAAVPLLASLWLFNRKAY